MVTLTVKRKHPNQNLNGGFVDLVIICLLAHGLVSLKQIDQLELLVRQVTGSSGGIVRKT